MKRSAGRSTVSRMAGDVGSILLARYALPGYALKGLFGYVIGCHADECRRRCANTGAVYHESGASSQR